MGVDGGCSLSFSFQFDVAAPSERGRELHPLSIAA